MIVDLGRLVFMDSSGLHLLATAAAHARQSDTRLVIAHPTAPVLRLLELTGMSDVLEIVDANRPASS